jgi:hypothetical protein
VPTVTAAQDDAGAALVDAYIVKQLDAAAAALAAEIDIQAALAAVLQAATHSNDHGRAAAANGDR